MLAWQNGRRAAFRDRAEAGRELAGRLATHAADDPIVLALPRGGVAVGYEVAIGVDAPLDVVVARKLGAPQQPELAIGAIAPGGIVILDETTARYLNVSERALDEMVRREMIEMERRIRLYRGNRPAPDLRGRTVIVVDDGLATGLTARAAVASVRRQGPSSVILASPVCARETAMGLRADVDNAVCLMIPPDFQAVGLWYEDFSQLTDDEVVVLLESARSRNSRDGAPA